jgi:hypothetical protein
MPTNIPDKIRIGAPHHGISGRFPTASTLTDPSAKLAAAAKNKTR